MTLACLLVLYQNCGGTFESQSMGKAASSSGPLAEQTTANQGNQASPDLVSEPLINELDMETFPADSELNESNNSEPIVEINNSKPNEEMSEEDKPNEVMIEIDKPIEEMKPTGDKELPMAQTSIPFDEIFSCANMNNPIKMGCNCAWPSPGKSGQSYTLLPNIYYGKSGVNSDRLDFYKSKKLGKRPLAIIVHGGGWRSGSKSAGFYSETAKQLVGLGFSVVSLGYPLASPGKNIFPKAIHSLRCGMRYLNNKASAMNIDTSRVVTIGNSAGGNLSSMLAYSPADDSYLDEVNCPYKNTPMLKATANIGLYGVYDLSAATAIDRSGATNYLQRSNKSQKIIQAKKASPVTYVDKNDPPSFISHCVGDPVVNQIQVDLFANKLNSKNVFNIVSKIPCSAHNYKPFIKTAPYSQNACKTLNFLRGALVKK